MKEKCREMDSSRRAEEIFRDYSGRRTKAVHALTNERKRERSSKVSSISVNLGYPQRPVRSLADPFSLLCRLTPPFASGRPVRGFLGGDFRFQRAERLCFVTIGPSFYLQIEAPVKHKHYRPAVSSRERRRKEMQLGTSPGHKLSNSFKSVFPSSGFRVCALFGFGVSCCYPDFLFLCGNES
ncbi:uncharacterized protein [Pyrus communis]|uniref:uncharacterized protein isoform X3 n=1 Tax=Pyrus communis TaxID=23211 RepID=UPI0035C1D53D